MAEESSAIRALIRALDPVRPDPRRLLAEPVAALLPALARRHRVSVLLTTTLARSALWERFPPDPRRELRNDALRARAGRERLIRLLRTVSTALDGAGVPFLLLKGAALGPIAYDEPAEREMSDVDLLVAEPDLPRALAALARAGLAVPESRAVRFWREAYFNVPVHAPGDEGARVEIHWSIAQARRHRPDLEGIFRRARKVTIGGLSARAPGPADLFLHQALHLAYHYHQPRLSWLIDLARLSQREPVASRELGRRARRWGMATALWMAATHVEHVFPGALAEDLRAAARGSLRARLLPRLLPSRDPVALIGGWNRRPVQLALALCTLDGAAQMASAFGSWLWRFARHGDRAGHREIEREPR